MQAQNKLVWTRMAGAGNSFWMTHFLNKTTTNLKTNWSKRAQILCKTMPFTDGLLVLLPSEKADFKWLFYNANGSEAEMCGNAACCVVDYVFKKNLIATNRKTCSFETLAEIVQGDLHQNSPRIFLKERTDIQGPFKGEILGEKVSYMFIDSGVPHAVIRLEKPTQQWQQKKAQAQVLRKKQEHHPAGMNVSFYYEKPSLSELQGSSYERGVEDFTPACGTGALAMACVHRKNYPQLSDISVQMPGGELKIKFHSDKTISLMSPVEWLEEMQEEK